MGDEKAGRGVYEMRSVAADVLELRSIVKFDALDVSVSYCTNCCSHGMMGNEWVTLNIASLATKLHNYPPYST